MLLSLYSNWYDYRHVSPCLIYTTLGIKNCLPSMREAHSIHQTISIAPKIASVVDF